MPHIIVEYSANLDAEIDPPSLLRRIHDAVIATGVFPLGGIRTRAARRDLFVVADGNAENGFVAVTMRIGKGRDEATRKRVAEQLMTVLSDATETAFAARGLSLSVEIEEIDEAGAARKNNLHGCLAGAERQPYGVETEKVPSEHATATLRRSK